jgi:hypothetical protein
MPVDKFSNRRPAMTYQLVELGGALLESVQRLAVAVVADPELCLDEHLRTVDRGTDQRFTDLLFVAVGCRGVDVAVAGRQGGLDGSERLVGRGLEDAEADRWQLHLPRRATRRPGRADSAQRPAARRRSDPRHHDFQSKKRRK